MHSHIDRLFRMELSSGGRKARRFFVGLRDVRARTAEDRQLLEMLDPVAESLGLSIVRLRLMGGVQRRLQIMAERPEDHDIVIEQCVALSRACSDVLEAADPINGEYVLEVSSPGIDRPLTRLEDFVTYEGYEAKLELDRLADGRKRFKGLLAGVEGDNVGIDLEDDPETTTLVPFAWIIEAKLVLSDELLKRGAEQRAARLVTDQDSQDQEEEEA
jgi:ribosome maturation factor RimP